MTSSQFQRVLARCVGRLPRVAFFWGPVLLKPLRLRLQPYTTVPDRRPAFWRPGLRNRDPFARVDRFLRAVRHFIGQARSILPAKDAQARLLAAQRPGTWCTVRTSEGFMG